MLTGDGRGGAEDRGLAYAKETLTGLGGSFGGIATLVAVFTAAGTVALSVGQRTREFALLRAVGATPRQIRRAVAAEALLVAPLAGLAGCLPGIGLAHWWFGQLKDRGVIPEAVELHVSMGPTGHRRRGRAPHGTRRRLGGRAQTREDQTGAGTDAKLGGAAAAGRRPYRPRAGRPRRRRGPRLCRGLSAGDDAAGASLGVIMLFMLAFALLGPLVARLCAALFGLLLRGGGAAAALAAANSRTNARRLASAITPIVLAMAFASTLVFMHTSESKVASDQLRAGITADHVVTDPAGMPAGRREERAARAPGVDAAVSPLRHAGAGAR